MKKIDVIIINGKPRSGKDTVIDFMREYCFMNQCARTYAYSTIDPVKNALTDLGWDMAHKDDDTRNLLAAMKQWWINYNNGPLKWCMDRVIKECINTCNDDVVLIFQIREPSEIRKLVNALQPMQLAYGLNVSTLFVNRSLTREKAYGNSSDSDVANYEYDAEINNDGTIDQLGEMVGNYMDNLLLGGERNE